MRRGGVLTALAVPVLLLLVGAPGVPTLGPSLHAVGPSEQSARVALLGHRDQPQVGLPTVSDDARLLVATALGTVGVRDSVTAGVLLPSYRSYNVTITVTVALPTYAVGVVTDPVAEWAFPDQLPGGPDNLPSFAGWRWWVSAGGVNDTVNWTVSPNGTELVRTVALLNASFTVQGASRPVDPVSVGRGLLAGTSTPAVGVVMANPVPPGPGNRTVPELTGITEAIDPQIIRFGLSSVDAVTGWDNATDLPVLNFTVFDSEVAFIRSVSATALLSLPAGTWGDGNFLPDGMPLNDSVNVTFYGSTGQFPALAEYASLIGAIVNHTVESGESIGYWNVGNEVPVYPTADAQAYAQVFDVAARAIHHRLPGALVGSDVLTVRAGLPTLTADLTGVGFLSYHLYSSTTICFVGGVYCPPTASGPGLSDPVLLTAGVGLSKRYFYAPHLAQELWYNATGRWIPVIDTESNLDTVGGGVLTSSSGTDPRMQTLLGATWVTSMLISAAAENVSELTYFNLQDAYPASGTATAPMGGWGFGLSGVTPNRTSVEFAPFWALHLWSQAFPLGGPAVPVTVGDGTVLRGFAAQNGTGVSLVVANLVNVPVRVGVSTTRSGEAPQSVDYLDGSTYQQPYNASNGTAYLAASGIASRSLSTTQSGFLLGGYGVALVHLAPVGTNGSAGNGSGNGSGNSSGSGGGNGTGGSGNQTGSGNTSGNQTGQGNSSSGGGTGGGNSSGGGPGDSGGSSTGGSSTGSTGSSPRGGPRIPPHPPLGTGTSPTVALTSLADRPLPDAMGLRVWQVGLAVGAAGVLLLVAWSGGRQGAVRPPRKRR